MNNKLYLNYFEDQLKLFPSINESLNLPKYKHLNNLLENSYSEEHKKKQKEFCNKYLKILEIKKNKNIYDKLIIYECKKSLEFLKSDLVYLPITHEVNNLINIMELGSENSLLIFNTKKDYDNVLEKLSKLEEITNSIIDLFKMGIKKKIVFPKILGKKLYEQFESFKKNKSYKSSKIKIKLDYDFNEKLEELITPPLDKIIFFLKNTYIKYCVSNISLGNLPNGEKMYKLLVSNSLTLKNISIKSIHNYGLKEVNRIETEMNKIKDHYNFKGNLKDFFIKIKSLNEYKFKSTNDVLLFYKNTIKHINKNILPKYFNIDVKNLNCDLKKVPKFNEDFSGEAYYIQGDILNKRKGTFYINLKNFKQNNKIEGLSLTLHESNPGHHYQSTYVIESKNIPLFVKLYLSEAYSEGWALYVENLGDYNNITLFGKYVNEMLRAVRLVVDTGIHYYNWSYKKAFNFIKKYLFDSDDQIHTQLLRYIADPSQALAYKMGEKFFLDLLKQEKKKINFDIKVFHNKLLENGPLPLFLLKEKF